MTRTARKKAPEAEQGIDLRPYPEKLYYKIGEICEITGLPAHVLRFWEREFPQLSPNKTRSGHRLYRKRDIETILTIKELLKRRKYTIQGAREYLDGSPKAEPPSIEGASGEVLGRLRDGLSQLQERLNRQPPL